MQDQSKSNEVVITVSGIAGAIIGLFLAIVPLAVLMEVSYRTTGYDAGNAGVFFVCTVPTFPVLGGFLGVWIARRRVRRRGQSQ